MLANSRLRPSLVFVEIVITSMAVPRLNRKTHLYAGKSAADVGNAVAVAVSNSCNQLAAVETDLLQIKIMYPTDSSPSAWEGHAKYLAS